MDKMSASLHISANAHIVILQAYDRACDLTRSGLTSTTPLDDGNAMRKAAYVALALSLSITHASQALACTFTYKAFEATVPHLDLDACPAGLPQAKAFCRATIANGNMNVFAFAEDGDPCLLGVKTLGTDEYHVVMKPRS